VLSWVLVPCGFVSRCRRFGVICFLHLQSWSDTKTQDNAFILIVMGTSYLINQPYIFNPALKMEAVSPLTLLSVSARLQGIISPKTAIFYTLLWERNESSLVFWTGAERELLCRLLQCGIVLITSVAITHTAAVCVTAMCRPVSLRNFCTCWPRR
jgi:hypothetical protein